MATDKESFEKWLDGEKVDDQTIERWQHDESLKDHYETGLYLKHQADCYEQSEVPNWNREATFGFDKKPTNWFAWLNVSPALSLSMSLAAILMVLFKVELQVNEQGIMLAFGASSEAAVIAEVDRRLSQFSADQQIAMANYVDDIQAQQKQDVAQLATYLVQSSREERREDMAELVTYLNDQRDDDMSLQNRRISNILFQVKQSSGDTGFKKASFEGPSNPINNQEEK